MVWEAFVICEIVPVSFVSCIIISSGHQVIQELLAFMLRFCWNHHTFEKHSAAIHTNSSSLLLAKYVLDQSTYSSDLNPVKNVC